MFHFGKMQLDAIPVDNKIQPTSDEMETMEALFPQEKTTLLEDAMKSSLSLPPKLPKLPKQQQLLTTTTTISKHQVLASRLLPIIMLTTVALIVFSPPIAKLTSSITRTNNKFIPLAIGGVIFAVAAFVITK